ncbi:MAG: squalene/phytoene synthase family protein [Steroidobacteraceae bacterium]
MKPPQRPLEEPYRGRAVPPGTARYWSWLFSARECREPLLGIYALLAEWRALMDPGTEAKVAQLKLAWWQDEIERLSAGSPVHPIGRYLAALPRAGLADFAPLARAVEAASRQVAGAPLERGEELKTHSSALRGGPLLVAARLAGSPAAEAEALLGCVSALAAGEYLAGAIADYRRAARFGRVAFPVDELLAARIEDTDLGAADPPPHLQSYLDGVRRRGAQLFAEAADALPRAERAQLRHLLVLAALGANHLNDRRSPADADFRVHDLYLAWSTARRAALER